MSRASRLLIAVALLSSVLPFTAAQSAERTYEVTITNLTKGQPLSPPVVVVHDAAFRLFAVGTPASEELAAVAEDANVGPLLTLLDGEPAVRGFAVFDGGPVPPGASATVEVTASGALGVVSALGMLVTTNDAFFAGTVPELQRAVLVGSRSPLMASAEAPAYDAGSERNTENCDHIPGPPCMSPFQRVTDGAEGYVYVHAGVHGSGDLDAAMRDWRNPVARISVRRIH